MIDYVHHSPSSCTLFAADTAMWVTEKILGFKQPVGAPAHRGTAVERGVTFGLLDPDIPVMDCVKVAFRSYDQLMALSPDPRRETYREGIADMVQRALAELRPYGVPTATQGFVTWQPDGLRHPFIGYFDFRWDQHGIINDLKTTEKMPSEIRISHARQVSLYALNSNAKAKLTYVTPRKCVTYDLENMHEHRETLRQIAIRIENYLALSDEPDFFKSICAPDLDSYYWNNPAARQLAFEIWRI